MDSDADRIRAKRLAKLGGSGSTATPLADSSSPATPAPTDGTSEKPQSTTPVQTEQKPAPKINIRPRPTSPSKREHDGSERLRPKPTERTPESLDLWQDRNLRQVFRVTLKSEDIRDAHGNTLVYIASTKDDLVEQNLPLLLNVDILEGAITEAAGQARDGKIFEYLLQCFKRVSRGIRGLKVEDEIKLNILKETRRLCMSYCIFAVTMPEMFGEHVPTGNPLVEHLLADPECDLGICTDFLTEASSRFEEDETIKEAIVGTAEELSRQLAQKDMLADYQNYVRGLRNLLRFPKIVDAVTMSPMWAPADVEAQDIETKTLLGPFFRLSPMQQSVANNYFSAPRTRDKGFIRAAQNAVRLTLRTQQLELFNIANTVVRAGAAQRERMLAWFALCVNKNHKKRAMRVDYRIVSSDGFMVNVTNALDQLCDPFMDASFGKIEKIDPEYLRRNPRVDISDETKINADQKTSDDFYAQTVEGTNNFITEVFFLTVAAHHYGTEAAQTRMSTAKKTAKRWEKDLEAFEAERHKYINQPAYLKMFEIRANKLKKEIDDMWSTIHATEGVLLDDLNQARSMQFMRYIIVWLLRLASGQNLPKEQLRLPLPDKQPDVFRCLPEYLLEDIVDNFKFITQWMPQIITPQQSEEIVQVCVTFLRSSEYVKNPGVKSGLVTILFYGSFPFGNQARGVLGDILIGSPFANKHLLHSLMKYYIEAENTGTHTQFYDKFNIRYEIFQVIKRIWVNTLYRENLAKEANVNTDFFIQFVNMLVNDATFVLDESLGSLVKIVELTRELDDPELMRSLDEQQRKEKQELLEEHRGKCKNYMQLTQESMETLILFTETLADAFTMKEIVTRLADMLDYNLHILTDDKERRRLRPKGSAGSAEDYGLKPRQLLADIMTIYCNLASKQSFITAIARDERSYRPANFAFAAATVSKTALKSPEEIRVWEELARRVAETKALEEEEEADLGDVPDEFVDPLMATLMTDPVLLPISKNIVDRSTIRTVLLSDPNDPFNRTPLKMEDVIPDEALKARIEAWRAEKKAERAAGKMDISEG